LSIRLHLRLERLILRIRIAELLLETLRRHTWRACTYEPIAAKLILYSLDDFREAANRLHKLRLQLPRFIMRVPEHLLGYILLLHGSIQLLGEPFEQDACIEFTVVSSG